ncbi:MAG: hypothetical protein V3T15_09625 [Pseudomonadales bacterium]
MRHTAAYLVVVLLLSSAPGLAQDQQDSLTYGDRVRVTAPQLVLHETVGRFEALRHDTLVVRADSALRIPLNLVTRLEISHGRSNSPMILGAAVGAVAGGVAGAALASTETCPGRFLAPDPCPVERYAGAIFLGVLLGGAVGGGVGAVLRTERWERAPVDGLRVVVWQDVTRRVRIAAYISF